MKATESIRTYLQALGIDHDPARLETQVNVRQGDGWPVEGRPHCYTDGLNDWWAIRIPKGADSDPYWRDYHLKWPLELYAEAIGSTGWNWQERHSIYVGFDFDSITGHAEGVGVPDDKLAEVRTAAKAVPWVQVRTSTSGKGIHLYAYLDGEVHTANHTEHAALARYVLKMMSDATGFDFGANIDTCGGNLWLWRRDQSPDGLKIIKPATVKLAVPNDWRDMVPHQTATVRVGGTADRWDRLAMAYRPIPLDIMHREHIDTLIDLGFPAIWSAEKNMLTTHTLGFKRLAERFPIRGHYQTNSPGKKPSVPNCFAFPSDFGGWRVYRFGEGTVEAPPWTQDGKGWTHTTFNCG